MISFTDIICVGAGSALGGIARYVLSIVIQDSTSAKFPWGTLTVNATGCLILGLICGWQAKNGNFSDTWRLLLTVGFCGGFTTFSTFINENFLMLLNHNPLQFVLYTLVSIIAGLLLLFCGYSLTS